MEALTVEYRMESAQDVHNNYSEMYDRFTTTTGEFAKTNKLLFVFSGQAFKAGIHVWCMARFLTESQEIVDLMKEAVSHEEKHNLVCAYNDLLYIEKQMLINFIEFANLYPQEDATEMFEVFTYGGQV